MLWLAPVIVLIVVGVGVVAWVGAAVVFRHSDPDPSDRITRFESGPGVLPVSRGEGDDEPDMIGVATTYDDEGSRTQVVRSTFGGDVRWRSQVEVESLDRLVTVVDDVAVLAREGNEEVTAIDLRDGTEAWSATLPIDPTCADCLEVIGGALVARDLEGGLTAVDPASGGELWSRSGPGVGDALTPAIVEETIVVGEALPDDAGYELVVVDAADGSELRSFRPTCANPVDDQAEDEVLWSDSFVVTIPSTGDVVAVFGYDGRCVQRWDTATAEQEWGVAVDVGFSALGAVATERHLAFSAPAAAVVVDLEDGDHVELPTTPETSPAPLAITDEEILLAQQVPDQGEGNPVSLQGWDLDDEDVRWSPPGVPGPFAAADELGGRGRSAYDPSALTVVVPDDEGAIRLASVGPLVDGEAPTLRVATVDPTTGELSDERSVSLVHDPDHIDPVLVTVHGVAEGRLAVTSGGIPQLVDLATGEVVAHWPVPG